MIENSKKRQRQQIAAGTHTTCPVCKRRVEIKHGRTTLHYDLVANNIDVPCAGSRKAVR